MAKWLKGRAKRRGITLSGEYIDGDIENYEHVVRLHKDLFEDDKKPKKDLSDIAFTDQDGVTLLTWLTCKPTDEEAEEGVLAFYKVTIPLVPASTDKTIYFYWDAFRQTATKEVSDG